MAGWRRIVHISSVYSKASTWIYL